MIHTVLSHENVKINKVLILCPVNTILNWVAEFEKWLGDTDEWKNINVYELSG